MVARARLACLIALGVVCTLIWVYGTYRERDDTLRVVFFDVGQGDAIFIESPTGAQVLIDGGASRAVLRSLSHEMGFFDRTIDTVVATHPDTDHIGGLVDVLERYAVATVVMTENKGESLTADTFRERVEGEEATIHYARRGMRLVLGGGAVLDILFPDRDPMALESNASSIIARLVYGEHEFLFTGDAPMNIEEYLVSLDGEHLSSDVLKIGHHGSRTSTSPLFLDAVSPAYGVISAGADNRYGHPHADVVDLLRTQGIELFETMEGNVAFESDGANLWHVE